MFFTIDFLKDLIHVISKSIYNNFKEKINQDILICIDLSFRSFKCQINKWFASYLILVIFILSKIFDLSNNINDNFLKSKIQ